MKWYFYIMLGALCELPSVSSIYNHTSNPADLLRILYLEKSALREFSFEPFPLFVMLCTIMKIILSIIFITSNIPKRDLVISRFVSRRRHFGYLIRKQAGYAVICSAAMTLIPAVLTVLLCGFSDIARLSAVYFPKQFVLLYFASGISTTLRKRLNSGAADILGAMLVIVLIMVDIFADISTALIDLSENCIHAIVCEAAVCLASTAVGYALYKRENEII